MARLNDNNGVFIKLLLGTSEQNTSDQKMKMPENAKHEGGLDSQRSYTLLVGI